MNDHSSTGLCRLSVLSSQFSVLAVVCLFFAGCVERTLIIRSDPVGAEVIVNGEPSGLTPVRIPFHTYGTFEVIASHPGHHRLREAVPVKPPWYETMPLDFFVENLWPFTVRDDHAVTLTLRPLSLLDETALEERERRLREQVEQGPALP